MIKQYQSGESSSNKLKYEWLIKMLSAYRENILILLELVQILEQIFNSEVMRNYLYLSNLPK